MAEIPEDQSVTAAKFKQVLVGKHLRDMPTPAAVVDRAVVQRNCEQMLDACSALQVYFRPHVKTHKVQYALAKKTQLIAHGETDSPGSLFLFYAICIRRPIFFSVIYLYWISCFSYLDTS